MKNKIMFFLMGLALIMSPGLALAQLQSTSSSSSNNVVSNEATIKKNKSEEIKKKNKGKNMKPIIKKEKADQPEKLKEVKSISREIKPIEEQKPYQNLRINEERSTESGPIEEPARPYQPVPIQAQRTVEQQKPYQPLPIQGQRTSESETIQQQMPYQPLPVQQQNAQGNLSTISFAITVKDSKTHAAISDAQVQLSGIGSKTTNSEGKCVFAGISPGRYSVYVAKEGYKHDQTVGYNLYRSNESTTVLLRPANFGDGAPIQEQQSGLMSSGKIAVSILDSRTGSPISGARISAVGLGGFRATDNTGSCLIENLAPQSYTLHISSQGYKDTTVPAVRVNDGQTTNKTVRLIPD